MKLWIVKGPDYEVELIESETLEGAAYESTFTTECQVAEVKDNWTQLQIEWKERK